MVARTGRSSLRGEARAVGADAGDERGAECAEGPPPPTTRSESALAAHLTSARCRGKIGSDVARCRVARDTPRALSTARRPRRTPHRPRVSRLSSARSPTWVKPPRNSVTAVRASPRRNTPPPFEENCIPPLSREKISRRCSLSPDLARDARSDRRARRSPRASREARPRPRAPPLARATNAHPPRPRTRFGRCLVPSSTVSNSSFFYPGVLSDSNPNKDRTTGRSGGLHQGAGNSSFQQPRLSRSPFASLAFSLPPDIEETGWGVPLYDEDVVERARTPRTSMDKPPSRRNSVDERHAPARKSLDLSAVRNKVADPPLR